MNKILELLKRAKKEEKEAELLKKKEAELLKEKAELLEKKAELLKKKAAELLEKKEAELLEKKEAELLEKKEAELLEKKEAGLLEKKAELLEKKAELLEKKAELLKKKEAELLEKKEAELLEEKEAELLEEKEAELLEEKEAELLEEKEAELLEKKEAELLEKKEAELLKIKEDIKEAFSKALGTLEEAKQELEGDRGSQQTRINETSGDKVEIVYLYQYGNILYGVKEYGRALKYYEEIVEQQHDVNAYKALGDCLRKLNLYDKALEQYKTALEKCNDQTNPAVKAAVFNSRGLNYIARAISNSYGATLYTSKMDNKKALKDFEKAIEISEDDQNPLYYCNKGFALYTLDRKEQGLDSLKEAKRLFKIGHRKGLTKQNIHYIENPLASFIELESKVKEIQTKFEEIQNKLNTEQYNKLREDINRIQKELNELLELFKSNTLKQEDINRSSEIDREEFKNKINQVTATCDEMNNDLQKVEKRTEITEAIADRNSRDIADIKKQLESICSDLSKKLQDYDQELEEYLGDQPNLNGTDKAKIKEYYKAFVGTIAATYIAAQVVDSGKVELEKPLVLTLVSAGFSFIPLVGEAISKGVEPLSSLISCMFSIGEKVVDEAVGTVVHKTSKGNARKIKQLATESSDLTQEVSIQIVRNEDKQKQIRNITLEYLNKQPGNLLQWFKKVGKTFDKYLYGEVYSTDAELLGNKDAETLIKQYLTCMIDKKSPQDGYEEAVQFIMKDVFYVINIVKIREEVSKGSCTQELRELFSKNYLEPKLMTYLNKATISGQEIEKAQMITFKYMCKAVKEDQNQNNAMACVKEFAKITQYIGIVKKVADKHPEYFCIKEIAEQIIPDKKLYNKVLKQTSNFTKKDT